MNLPVLDLARAEPAALLAQLQRAGAAFVVDDASPAADGDLALADAARFFALPAADKQALAIERSPHFRGYGRMHNERDWREQIHFGRELPAVRDTVAPFWRLQGPNLWPADAEWNCRMRDYLLAVERTGHRLLAALAAALGQDHRRWLGADPYVLMKCIGYHPQPQVNAQRRGVAAHVDFSLVTLTLQDDVGGLEVRDPGGRWHPVPARRGAWLLHVGELLQYATGNRLLATPHRVVNPSTQRTRCSIPVFVAPGLAATLAAGAPVLPPPAVPPGAAHVHAVLDPAAPPPTLHFGAAEWRRKGENRWCATCAP